MTARSSNSFLASILLHGLFAGAILFSAYLLKDSDAQTKIMELVAGEGDNYGATSAPALGNPDSQKSDAPAAVEAAPAAPDIQPAPQSLEAVAPPSAMPVKPLTKTPDFTRTMARTEAREMKKFERRQKAEADAAAKAEAARAKEEAAKAKEAVKNNQMTKEEFDRRFGNKTNAATRSTSSGEIKVAKIDGKGIARGVVGGSTANTKGGAGGTALTREEGDMLDAYFSLLYQRLREAHQKPTDVSDLLSALAEYDIAHDGTISHVRIIHSSGSPEFDQSVLSAFRTVGSIGPRPDTGGMMTKKVLFRMKDE